MSLSMESVDGCFEANTTTPASKHQRLATGSEVSRGNSREAWVAGGCMMSMFCLCLSMLHKVSHQFHPSDIRRSKVAQSLCSPGIHYRVLKNYHIAINLTIKM